MRHGTLVFLFLSTACIFGLKEHRRTGIAYSEKWGESRDIFPERGIIIEQVCVWKVFQLGFQMLPLKKKGKQDPFLDFT